MAMVQLTSFYVYSRIGVDAASEMEWSSVVEGSTGVFSETEATGAAAGSEGKREASWSKSMMVSSALRVEVKGSAGRSSRA